MSRFKNKATENYFALGTILTLKKWILNMYKKLIVNNISSLKS